jgi:ParB-like chromosome segregation protein Spo0J
MARKLQIDVSADVEVIPTQYRNGTALSEVKKVAPSLLTMNKKNSEYFVEESEEYFTNLRNDIRQRGVIVPLIASRDGILIAGHNRLRIAIELKLPQVPVQYVQEDLSDEREREFIIKDNLFRRQLTTQEWVELYKKLFPDFESVFLTEETKVSRGRKKTDDSRLTIAKIAEETGQKYDTVKTQIRRARSETNETAIQQGNKNHKKGFTEPFSQNTDKTKSSRVSTKQQQLDNDLQNALTIIVNTLAKASPLLKKQAQTELRKLLKSL